MSGSSDLDFERSDSELSESMDHRPEDRRRRPKRQSSAARKTRSEPDFVKMIADLEAKLMSSLKEVKEEFSTIKEKVNHYSENRGNTFRAQSKPRRRPRCTYCHRLGHDKERCFSLQKVCFNCGGDHLVSICPKPSRKQIPNPLKRKSEASTSATPAQDRLTRNKRFRSMSVKKPNLVRMPLGHAKLLQRRLAGHQDACFSIAGNLDGPDDKEVWVTMGDEEEQEVAHINYCSEKNSGSKALTIITDSDDECWA